MITEIAEIGIATATTTIVATNINADGLITALIGFGTALITVVGGKLIEFLTAYLKNKTDKLNSEKDEEENKHG